MSGCEGVQCLTQGWFNARESVRVQESVRCAGKSVRGNKVRWYNGARELVTMGLGARIVKKVRWCLVCDGALCDG